MAVRARPEALERIRAALRAGDIELAEASARALLPRAAAPFAPAFPVAPRFDDGQWIFENDRVRAAVLANGTLVALEAAGARNLVAQANFLAHYPDPFDERRRRAASPQPPALHDGTLEIPFRIGDSRATMGIELRNREPFLRVELAVDWRERRRLLRLENWLAVRADASLIQAAASRFALIRDTDRCGLAILVAQADAAFESASLPRGGVRIGGTLLRAAAKADRRSEPRIDGLEWAYLPVAAESGNGSVEHAWEAYALEQGVRLFDGDDDSVIVDACAPAGDGDGVIVRVRECDGSARTFSLRCGGRMREAVALDGGDARIQGERLFGSLGANAERSFRVRF